jgi:hypothetical protein
MSHGAVHPAGDHHGWQADHELHSGDDFAVSIAYRLINAVKELYNLFMYMTATVV